MRSSLPHPEQNSEDRPSATISRAACPTRHFQVDHSASQFVSCSATRLPPGWCESAVRLEPLAHLSLPRLHGTASRQQSREHWRPSVGSSRSTRPACLKSLYEAPVPRMLFVSCSRFLLAQVPRARDA